MLPVKLQFFTFVNHAKRESTLKMYTFGLLVLTKPWLVRWAERILRESRASKIMLLSQRPWRSVKEAVSLRAKDETTRWRYT